MPELPATHHEQDLPAVKAEKQVNMAEAGGPRSAEPGNESTPIIAPESLGEPPHDAIQETVSKALQPSAEPLEASAGHTAPTYEDTGGLSKESTEDIEGPVAGIRHVADVGSEHERHEGSEKAESETQPETIVTLMEKLPAEEAGQLRQQWEALRAAVEGLKHVERFAVVTVAYRK